MAVDRQLPFNDKVLPAGVLELQWTGRLATVCEPHGTVGIGKGWANTDAVTDLLLHLGECELTRPVAHKTLHGDLDARSGPGETQLGALLGRRRHIFDQHGHTFVRVEDRLGEHFRPVIQLADADDATPTRGDEDLTNATMKEAATRVLMSLGTNTSKAIPHNLADHAVAVTRDRQHLRVGLVVEVDPALIACTITSRATRDRLILV